MANSQTRSRLWASIALFALFALACPSARAQSLPKLTMAMDADPLIDLPAPVFRYADDLVDLWILALQRDEADLKQLAARSIVWGQRHEMPGLEATIPHLTKDLSDERLIVRLAAAHALVALDAKQSSGELKKRADVDGLEMAQIVEPSLAKWKDGSRSKVWIELLKTPLKQRRRSVLALRALGVVGDTDGVEAMRKIVNDDTLSLHLRLAAADSLGSFVKQGLLADATKLSKVTGRRAVVSRLLAAKLIRNHLAEEAQNLAAKLALDKEPAVAAIALEGLNRINPDRSVTLVAEAIPLGDARVRRLAAHAINTRPSADNMVLLANLTRDANPSLRHEVGDMLLQLTQRKELKETIIRECERLLDEEDWRAQEQSARVLTKLDRKSIVPRLAVLLRARRPEVYVTAAWGIQRLNVPDVLAEAFAVVTGKLSADVGKESTYGGDDFKRGLDPQLAHLLQYLGQNKYQPAEEEMLKFVPKSFDLPVSRCAAIWALGYLHEGKVDVALARQLESRLADANSPRPELEIVRTQAAVALGRMKAQRSLSMLREWKENDGVANPPGYASAWSIQQITGEKFEKAKPPERFYSGFFLEPLP